MDVICLLVLPVDDHHKQLVIQNLFVDLVFGGFLAFNLLHYGGKLMGHFGQQVGQVSIAFWVFHLPRLDLELVLPVDVAMRYRYMLAGLVHHITVAIVIVILLDCISGDIIRVETMVTLIVHKLFGIVVLRVFRVFRGGCVRRQKSPMGLNRFG